MAMPHVYPAAALTTLEERSVSTSAPRSRSLILSAAALVGVGVLAPTLSTAVAVGGDTTVSSSTSQPVHLDVRAPTGGDNAGTEGKGWFVDLEINYPATGTDGLAASGFTGLQLTGPGVHNKVPPFPGTFSPNSKDDRLPGLVVLTSTTKVGGPFVGPGTNLANLFNLTGITDRSPSEAQIWDTWIVGDSIAGQNVDTTLTVAVVADLNHNGVYDDAPGTVTDLNGDGIVDAKDLETLGVASNIRTVDFHLNGAK